MCSLIANLTHDSLETVINANKSRFVNEEVMLFWKLLYLQNIKTESQARNNSRHQEILPFRSLDTVRAIYRQERPLLFPGHFAFCRLGFRMCGVLLSCLIDPKQSPGENRAEVYRGSESLLCYAPYKTAVPRPRALTPGFQILREPIHRLHSERRVPSFLFV